MIPKEVIKVLHEVPEEVIKDAAKFVGGKTSGWHKLLKAAQIFRHAGLTPVFLSNKECSQFCVTSEESYKNEITIH